MRIDHDFFESKHRSDSDILDTLAKLLNLSDCPHCQRPARIYRSGETGFYVMCTGCKARTGVYSSPEVAANKWNQRDELKELGGRYQRFVELTREITLLPMEVHGGGVVLGLTKEQFMELVKVGRPEEWGAIKQRLYGECG